MKYVPKLIGIVLVVFATTSYGIALSRDIKARLSELKELKKIIFLLKGEISFGHTPLLEAFDNIGRRCGEPFKGIIAEFVKHGSESTKKPFNEIWIQGMSAGLAGTHLNKEEQQKVLNLGNELGLSDVKTQQNAIDSFAAELDMDIEQLAGVVPGRVRLYHSMGIMLGIVIAIIMI